MIRSVKDIQRFSIAATDGAIGSVDELYFDDEQWIVRYIAVDTGKWLPGRRVLVSPAMVRSVHWSERRLEFTISREQVKNSPHVDTHKPVSRQQELAHHRYYGLPPYWGGPALWGAAPYTITPSPSQLADMDRYAEEEQARAERQGDDHLRSTREVIRYTLHANDGELGAVDDFLVDDETWAIRYIVTSTSQWWFGHQTLIPPSWIAHIDWSQQSVHATVTRQQVKSAPRYDRAAHIDRQWEADYFRHYGKPPYWPHKSMSPP